MKRVSVVIPAHNEAARIAATVRAVRELPEVGEVIVVDDASSDETAALAEKAGAKVLRLSANRGKGAALNEGVAGARGDVVVLLDADLGESAREARALILPVLRGEVDMTVARFPSTGKRAGFGLVKRLARAGIRYFTGLEVSAPLSGQRALSREVLRGVLPFARGYGVEVALTIRAARKGFRIKEIPVTMYHRETGRNLGGFIHRGRQFRDVLFTLGRLFFELRRTSKESG
ncbi:glycosyltransferase family 2 protein [Thermodesulfitimonas sp.]